MVSWFSAFCLQPIWKLPRNVDHVRHERKTFELQLGDVGLQTPLFPRNPNKPKPQRHKAKARKGRKAPAATRSLWMMAHQCFPSLELARAPPASAWLRSKIMVQLMACQSCNCVGIWWVHSSFFFVDLSVMSLEVLERISRRLDSLWVTTTSAGQSES